MAFSRLVLFISLSNEEAGQVHGPLAWMITVQISADVQQTTGLTKKEDFGPCVYETPGLVPDHRLGYLRVAQSELASKTAACCRIFQIYTLSAFYTGDELLGLDGHTQPPEYVTRLVVGYLALEGSADIGYTKFIHDILAQLKNPAGKAVRTIAPGGLIFEELGIMVFNHADTRACGTHYAFVIAENLYEVFGCTLRLVAVSGIEQGLPAAGLFRMIYGLFTKTQKQLVCRYADLRQHDVHDTRDEQGNLHNILA